MSLSGFLALHGVNYNFKKEHATTWVGEPRMDDNHQSVLKYTHQANVRGE